MNKSPAFHRVGAAGVAALFLALAPVAPGQAADPSQVTGKWITVVLPGEPPDLEGCYSSGSVEGRIVKQNVAETLIERNPKDFALKPRLATSWQQVNPTTWVFKLRPGVSFHDGSPFNAAAVKRSLERNRSKPLICKDQVRFFGDVPFEVSAVDDLTVQIVTVKPEPILPMRLAGTAIVGPNESFEKLSLAPVGTGPYAFDSWQAGQHILLKRFDTYWGDKPQADGVRYVWRAESAVRAAMVKIGEADIAVPVSQQDAADPALGFAFLNSETIFLRPDITRPPLNDRRVRLALNLALDRASVIGTILPKDAVQATQLLLPSIPGHNHQLDKELMPYDPARAKKLLAEAKADGVPVDNEIVLLSYPPQFPNAAELMEAFFGMYKAVGLNVKIQTIEYGQYGSWNYKPLPDPRPPTLMQASHDNSSGDPVFSFFYKFGCDSSNSTFCDPALDKEIGRVTDLSGQERIEAWGTLARKVYEDYVPVVFLHHMVGFVAVNPRIDFRPDLSSNGEIRVQEIHFK